MATSDQASPSRWRSRWVRVAQAVAAVTVAAVAVVLAGPRPTWDPEAVQSVSPPALDRLEAWLADRESDVTDLRQDADKRIVWADPLAKARTPVAIVYVHGFGADRVELEPVPQRVAKALGANLYLTRLPGHGRTSKDAMSQAGVEDWLSGTLEAIDVGGVLGERVVVMATSTGASLTTWAVSDARAEAVSGLIYVSPNFGVADPAAQLMTGPWGRTLVSVLLGPERSWEPRNAAQALHWNTRYSSQMLVEMQLAVDIAQASPFEQITQPVLAIWSREDTVVSAEATSQVMDRWGGHVDRVIVGQVDDASNHVLAGDAISPGQTDATVEHMLRWARPRFTVD